ncbi:iron-sulfur cluster insertion protein ErpA [Castellaniella sp. UC4442_H9]|jgi:iron-sulfur cluster insertion protein
MNMLNHSDLQKPVASPTLTAAAATRLRALMHEQRNPDLKLRVYVEGGGCSGFQYGFALETAAAADDVLIERDGAVALVDAMSAPYLAGAEVDFEQALQGAQFVVRNPNANATCGCGSSFAP